MILLRAGSELPRDYATAKLLKGFAYSHRTMVTLGNRGFSAGVKTEKSETEIL